MKNVQPESHGNTTSIDDKSNIGLAHLVVPSISLDLLPPSTTFSGIRSHTHTHQHHPTHHLHAAVTAATVYAIASTANEHVDTEQWEANHNGGIHASQNMPHVHSTTQANHFNHANHHHSREQRSRSSTLSDPTEHNNFHLLPPRSRTASRDSDHVLPPSHGRTALRGSDHGTGIASLINAPNVTTGNTKSTLDARDHTSKTQCADQSQVPMDCSITALMDPSCSIM